MVTALSGGRSSNEQRDLDSRVCELVHKRVQREPIDLAAHKVADPWLPYAEYLRRLDLSQTPPFDDIHDGSHEPRSHQQVLGFGGRESQVLEDISVGRRNVCRSFELPFANDSCPPF